MSLIKRPTPPTEIEKIQMANTQCLNVMKATAKNTFDLFWNNPRKTAQEICDQFNTDASKAFDLHAGLQQLIYAIDNTWVPLTPLVPYTVNENGSVTINYPPPPVEEEQTGE